MSSEIRPTFVQPSSNLKQRLDGRFSEGNALPSNLVQPCSRAGACVGAGAHARPPARTPARTRDLGLDEVGRLDGNQEEGQAKGPAKGKSLRDTMPQTANVVDWLRQEFGKEKADALVLQGKQGKGRFYAAEIGPDGLLREFGSTATGGRVVLSNDGLLQWKNAGRSQ